MTGSLEQSRVPFRLRGLSLLAPAPPILGSAPVSVTALSHSSVATVLVSAPQAAASATGSSLPSRQASALNTVPSVSHDNPVFYAPQIAVHRPTEHEDVPTFVAAMADLASTASASSHPAIQASDTAAVSN